MNAHAIETSIARIERDPAGIIRIRVNDGARLDVGGFKEILATRQRLAGGVPARVMALLPEDVDFEVQIMNEDHYAGIDASAFTKAFAIITQASLYTRLYQLYAAYFKPGFPVQVFPDEAAALVWLAEFPA
ncbi:MAG: hypothetical protein IPL52_05330 [Flavobacteriales bacterium]|nr:hypothetical protein [Flavobacteriales bacterium]